MKEKSLGILSLLLIILSFFCFSFGFYYDRLVSKQTLSDIQITTNADIPKDPDDLSITTVDSDADSNVNDNGNSSTNSNNTNNANNSNIESNSSFSNSTISMSQVNENLRKSIEDSYGVSIKYGEEVANYSVGGMTVVPIVDLNSINESLNNLNYVMSLYPKDFFREFAKKNLTLSIYLVKDYSTDNVTGVTDSSSNNVVMSISTSFPIVDSFNHEMYHYIDRYIYLSGGRYTTWNSLNPSDFTYGNTQVEYAYTKSNSPDSYFVNTYAEVSEFEDRASTFEYMMSSIKASCLEEGKTIYLKAKYMSNQIDLFFDTVSPNVVEYWERYLY